jgi:hypothetical protein
MFATILARYHGEDIDDSKETVFPDVPVNEWYTGSIGWNQEKAIVTGYEDGTFKPARNITREELVTMIKRYIDVYEADFGKLHVTDVPLIDFEFEDAAQVQDYAKEAVSICVNYGLIEGYPDKTFKPQQEITRAETAAIICRLQWIAPPPHERYFKVVAEVSKNGKSLASLSTQKHTIKEDLLVGKLAEEAFDDANIAAVENALDSQMSELSGIHNKVVTVRGDSYNVTVEPKDGKVVATAEKNGVALTAEDWNAQMDVEVALYEQRANDFAEAAKLTGEAKEAWDAAAAAFNPKELVTVEGNTLVLKDAADYAKAIQTAGVNLGIVAEKVGGDFEGYKALRDYLTDPEGLTIKEPSKDRYNVALDTIQEALSDETNVLAPVVAKGVPYTLGDANGTFNGVSLHLINLFTSRNYEAEYSNVSGIVAILKAAQEDANFPYLGEYEVSVTVQEVNE